MLSWEMALDNYPPKLNLLEKLDLIPAYLSLIAAAIYAATTGAFRGEWGAKSYSKHIKYAVIRQMFSRFSMRQSQSLNPPNSCTYEAFAKRNGFAPLTVKLAHGASGHWFGNENAENVLLYFHGGGFAMPANPAHLYFVTDIMDNLNDAGKDIAIFFLTYTFTPQAVYPTQLKQAVEGLRYLIQETGRSPSNVIIGGDSAGGNLTLAVLSHISHTHKAIEPLDISGPLAGVFLISPWVSFSQSFPSVMTNMYKDIITSASAVSCSRAYLADQGEDNYNQPHLAPAEWWNGIKASSVLILAGSDEILITCIDEFVEKFKMAVPNTSYFVGHDEPHTAPIVYRLLNDAQESRQGKELRSWLASLL
ncbi:steryl acetyl hydrolase 1 [Aspergillus udagawae]|uniref:Steryl acetyl hydrolase 1 n=1 Tax=Aspergillus udagawae TaxID=91492 RepID=A0A8H3XR82_9EURO|nr:uncharacterized protein Aud_009287 [Aspergillus udagawae]GFF57922.1 steryl acetyl hydrolase 1 [Aspergillus udagawae]GIC92814.1 hypothetical protein Aud_009287 [Aspergillus udagawae]